MFFLITILVLLFSPLISIRYNNNIKDNNHSSELYEYPKYSGYWLLNERIEINGNNGWETLNDTEDWCTGSGTKIDPYVIKDIVLDGQKVPPQECMISISGSNVHFRIKSCSVINNKGFTGMSILLNQVSNGTLIDNHFENVETAIGLINCKNITVKSNEVINNMVNGILLMDCEYTEINHNTLNNNNNGIISLSGENITILENEANNNGYYGIMVNGSKQNVIANNTTSYNDQFGIVLNICEQTEIKNNTSSYNGLQGIGTHLCNELSILNNEVAHNLEYGIGMESCEYCTVQGNTVNTALFKEIL